MNKLDELDIKLLERISNKLSLKIDIKEIDNEFYIKQEEYYSILDELYDYVGHLEERIEDLEQDINNNYEPKHIDEYEYYGVSRKDF